MARTALAAAYRYGFVLGGGLALIEHGLVVRPTEDVDLFASGEGSVAAATTAVTGALLAAGLRVETIGHDSDLDDLIAGMAYQMAELAVFSGPDDPDGLRVSLGFLDRSYPPVVLDIGPVMAVDDLIAWKVAALAGRAEVRDFIDVAVFLADRDVDQLLSCARRVDPALEPEDVAAAGRRLDRTPDRAFLAYGVDPAGVAGIRARFARWPRHQN
ncbi:nucleotidyl transferase AbiEii/AbiGii toxin family protein [Actinoplanes sp. NPDC026670]|uniref:nucleotidyl transferase AbiEii/AbiGii toxin family protein n=1 Tax=Actinoplanes sp. NPDC026670 TaxID=3154700 RepID=UPI0033C4257B